MSNHWAGHTTLVTGATGLIGSWLVKDLLARDARVVVLVLDADPRSELISSGDYERCHVITGDLADYATVKRAVTLHDATSVFHLGAQTLVGVAHRAPLATFESNIRGSYNVLEACRQHADLVQQVVVASSDKAYGETQNLPYKEDMPLEGKHPYEVSKTCTDLLAQTFAHTYQLPVAIARFGNVYGGGDLNFSRIVPDTIRSLLNGRRPIIRSDGSFKRDYVYVKDVCDGYLKLAERISDKAVRGQAFNFSGEQPTTVLEIVDAIRSQMNCEHLAPDIQNSATGEIRDQYLSAEKARTCLGWAPKHDLATGLRETIAWYREHVSS